MTNQQAYFAKFLTAFSCLFFTHVLIPIPVKSQPDLTMNNHTQLSVNVNFEFTPQDGKPVPEETKP